MFEVIRMSFEYTHQPLESSLQLFALEDEARKHGDPELVAWARQINAIEAHLCCGQSVPPEELEVLLGFMDRHGEGLGTISAEAARG